MHSVRIQTKGCDAIRAPDGDFVAFISNSTNLVSDDDNASNGVVGRDLDLGVTTRVSITSVGTEGYERGGGFGISRGSE